MRPILEEFSDDIKARLKTRKGGSTPVPLSEIFSSDKVSQIKDKIQKFFNDDSFTYEKFKGLLIWGPYANRLNYSIKAAETVPEPKNAVFLMGQEKLAGKFSRYDSGQTNPENMYDEFIETFYIYLYYEAFSKIFSDKKNIETILSNNKDNIDRAKREIEEKLRDVENAEGVKADLIENVTRFYNIFMESLSFSIVDSDEMAVSPKERKNYFEGFVAQNIGLFENYPISMNMNKNGVNTVKDLIDAIFNTITDENFPGDNRQIRSIRALSDCISYLKNNIVDLDVAKLQPKLDTGLRQRDAGRGETLPNMEFGRQELQPSIINDIIEILSDDEDLISDVGASWARGTKWEPYIKLMCSVVCFTGVFENLKILTARNIRKGGTRPVRVDVGEADNGLYYINNRAFVKALEQVGEGDLVKNIDQMIKNFSKKVEPFETDENRLIRSLFFDPPPKSITDSIGDYNQKDKQTMQRVLKITGVMEGKTDLNTMVAEINKIFFRYPEDANDSTVEKLTITRLKKFERVIAYAAANSADVDLLQVRPDFLSKFNLSSVTKTVVDAKDAIGDAFSKIWDELTKDTSKSQTGSSQSSTQTTGSSPGNFSLGSIMDAFNDAFDGKFGFVRMETTQDKNGKTVCVIRDEYGEVAKTLTTTEEIKTYIYGLCITSGSMLYHAKVLFGNSPANRDKRYYEYFNVLSWFLKSAEEYGKLTGSTSSQNWPLVYKVTPFLIDFVKYSMRDFVNNIDFHLKSAGIKLDKEFEDALTNANNAASGTLQEEQWKGLSEQLQSKIVEYFKIKEIGKAVSRPA